MKHEKQTQNCVRQIKNQIKNVSNLEECYKIKALIKEQYNSTPSKYWESQEDYEKLFFFVLGMEFILKKVKE